MDALLLSARSLLVVVFGAAAIGKLLDLEGSRQALEEFGVPARTARIGGVALPVAELAVAIGLLVRPTARWAALAALVLLLAFAAAVSRAMARGRAPECHCFGQIHSEPAGASTLIRNLGLAALATVIVVAGPGPSLNGALASLHGEDITVVALAVVAALLAAAAAQLWAERRRFARELAATTSARVDPALGPPPGPNGLPHATPAPEFALEPVRGDAASLQELTEPGRSTVLVFISTGCTSCLMMLTALSRWQHSLSGVVTLAAIFAGERDDIEHLAEEHGLSLVLADEASETFELYALRGTPAAVIVGADGKIFGSPAEGAAAIEALIRSALPAPDVPEPVANHV